MIQDIIAGIKAYGKAIGLIKKLNFWKYFLIPTLIGLLTGRINILIISFIAISLILVDHN